MMKQLFSHWWNICRVNNTGWMMKWWWNRGVERQANPDIERMLNVFDLHFSTPAEKAVSRICASKTRRNLQTFGWCLQFKQSCPWATLSYFCLRNKAGKINSMGRVVLRKMFQKSSALSILFEMRRSENHNLFVKFGSKRELDKKEICDH